MKEKLNNEFWKWVDEHAADDSKKMWLKYGKTHAEAIVQVECRQRFGKKLAATLLRVPQWYFPSVLSGEQATGDSLYFNPAYPHAQVPMDGNTAKFLTVITE